jgi:hypothetical protein
MRFEHESLRQGLVGCWMPSLGASGLTLIDRSGRNNHGTLTNMGGQNNWLAGIGGLSIPLDGVNDYVDCGSSARFALTTSVTMSAWVYPTSFAANRARIVDTPGLGLKIGTSIPFSDVNAFVVASTVAETRTATGVVALNAWHHLAAVWSSESSIAVYVNGSIPAGTVTQTSASGSILSTGNLELGRLASPALYGNHRFDDVRIYNRALTPPEIRLLASRRGIGLSPLPDRAAGLPRKLFVNVGGTWRDGDAYVNTGSGWRLGVPFVNAGGTWK